MKDNHSFKEIGAEIGKDKSVISRELKRNCNQKTGKYQVDLAQRKYDIRHPRGAVNVLLGRGAEGCGAPATAACG